LTKEGKVKQVKNNDYKGLVNNYELSYLYNWDVAEMCLGEVCLVVKGIENEHVYTKQVDIVYKDDNLYFTDREPSKPEERIEYANRLKDYFINAKNDIL
jgi:hypothetical protein